MILKKSRGYNVKFRPYAFTEQGVAMLSSVLRSERAVQGNIAIMRLRQAATDDRLSRGVSRRLDELEAKHDGQFKVFFDAIRALMEPPVPPRRSIGF